MTLERHAVLERIDADERDELFILRMNRKSNKGKQEND